MNWFEHLKYEPSTPGGLIWIRYAANNRIKPGDVAGKYGRKYKDLDERGYYRTYVVDRTYANHRIIWEMFNRPLESGEQVDHIDGNTKNNRIENLRVTNNQNNCYNQRKRKTNKSGITGVHITDNGSGTLYWTASWMDNGKSTGKSFSINVYGYEGAKELAIKLRTEAVEILKQSGIEITERHGT